VDVTGWPLLEEAYSGEATVMHMAKNLIGAVSLRRNVRRTTLSVWTVRARGADFLVVFWTPISRVDMYWKADAVAEEIHFVHKARQYTIISATTPTGELFQFEVFPGHVNSPEKEPTSYDVG
jgi:hypothetical protein